MQGQTRLKAAKVLVVGAGGIGSSALLYLTSSGVGTIGIVDHDDVETCSIYITLDCGIIDSSRAVTPFPFPRS